MKDLLLSVLVLSFLIGITFDLRAQEEVAPTAVIEGKIRHFKGKPGGLQIRCRSATLTAFRPETVRGRVQEDGTFRIEIPLYNFQEVRLQYLGETIHLLAGPDDHLQLEIDADKVAGKGHPWAAIRVKGSRADTNRELLAYLGNFPYRIKRASAADGQHDPHAYRKQALSLLEASLNELDSYRRGHYMNDTIYDWAVQELRFTTARNLFVQAQRRAENKKDEHLVYRLAASGYFEAWEPFKKTAPGFALSWAYRMFLSTYLNFLPYKWTMVLAPNYESMDAAAKKEFAYVYGDTIIMKSVQQLIDQAPSLFRLHSLALYCGNALQFPLSARVIQPAYIQAIRDKALRQRVRAKYEQSRAKNVALTDPSMLVTPPDTVGDIVSWAGRHFAGQVVLLDFWATWCGSCLYSIENDLPDMVKKLEDQPVVFLLVGVGSERNFLIERANRFPVKTNHLFPTAAQEEVLRDVYKIKGLPRYILLGRDGAVVDDRAPKPGPELEGRIRELLD